MVEKKRLGPATNELHSSARNEVELGQMILVLWKKKLQFFMITLFFCVVSVAYALSLPDIYKATTVLAQSNQTNSSSIGNLASQYGGLAAMAGIDLSGGKENKISHAIEMLKSWPFIEMLSVKYDMKRTFMATEGWNKKENILIYDDEIFDSITLNWKKKNGKSLEPTSYETYEELANSISINLNKDTGLITLSVKHFSPHIAKSIVEAIKNEINNHFKKIDKKLASRSISLLSEKLKETDNSDVEKMFFSMIETHTKSLLMTEVSEEYLVKTIIPVMVPEKKSEPSRLLICILGGVLGLLFSLVWIIARYFI